MLSSLDVVDFVDDTDADADADDLDDPDDDVEEDGLRVSGMDVAKADRMDLAALRRLEFLCPVMSVFNVLLAFAFELAFADVLADE